MDEVDLYDVEFVRDKIITLISKFEKAKTIPYQEVPYCNKQTRWQDDPIWKVYKLNKNGSEPKQIRAVSGGNCASEEEALMLIASKKEPDMYRIKYCESKPEHCINYCLVAKCGLCDYAERWEKGTL